MTVNFFMIFLMFTMGFTGKEKIFDIFRKCIVGDVIIDHRDSMDNSYTFYRFNYWIGFIS